MTHKIVITRHRPWLRWALAGVVGAAATLGAWALYSYTRATTVSDFEQTREERQQLLEERRALKVDLRAARAENQQLREQVVYLQQSQSIDQQACTAVKGSLKDLQSEVADLQEQVAFYRGIVSPTESRAGVRIYDFKVARAETAGMYRYDLVLIQSVRHDRRISGSVDIVVQGTRNGSVQTVRLADAGVGEQRNLLFSFKYFQEFTGQFKLPDGFRPLRATVAVVPEGNDSTRVEDVFDWNKIQGS